jgi:hypothetical protein
VTSEVSCSPGAILCSCGRKLQVSSNDLLCEIVAVRYCCQESSWGIKKQEQQLLRNRKPWTAHWLCLSQPAPDKPIKVSPRNGDELRAPICLETREHPWHIGAVLAVRRGTVYYGHFVFRSDPNLSTVRQDHLRVELITGTALSCHRFPFRCYVSPENKLNAWWGLGWRGIRVEGKCWQQEAMLRCNSASCWSLQSPCS